MVTPVEQYHGTLVDDYDVIFYSCGDNHRECLSHVICYLKESIENEPNLICNKRMLELVREMIYYRNCIYDEDQDEVKKLEDRNKEILELARNEYEYEPPSKYYMVGTMKAFRFISFLIALQ